MTAQVDFLPFAVGAGANVETQTAWAAESVLLSNGFQAGIAPSAKFNKALRQASIMSASLAQFIAAETGANVIDDGTTSTIVANMAAAVNAMIAAASTPSTQTLTDVRTTPGRSSGTDYTNGTGRSIKVYIQQAGNGSSTPSGVFSLTANGVTVTQQVQSAGLAFGGVWDVPPGATYRYTASTTAIISWHEYR